MSKLLGDYLLSKCKGKQIRVRVTQAEEERKDYSGTLIDAGDDYIVIRDGKVIYVLPIANARYISLGEAIK